MHKPDYGASHDFGKKHGKGELRISRTVYIKEKHLRYASDMCDTQGFNISEAIDILLQSGIAWQEKLKFDNQEKLSKYEPKI